MTTQLEASLHHFNPNHFGGLNDFRSTAGDCERDTLMLACAAHGTAPDSVSFAGTDRFFVSQHIGEPVPLPEDCVSQAQAVTVVPEPSAVSLLLIASAFSWFVGRTR